MVIRVRFNRNVMGRRAGEKDWVEATPAVETLVRVGYLTWLDRPVEDTEIPDFIPEPFDDGRPLETDGRVMDTEEFLDRLAIPDHDLQRADDDDAYPVDPTALDRLADDGWFDQESP